MRLDLSASLSAKLVNTLERLELAREQRIESVHFGKLKKGVTEAVEQFGNLAAPPEPPLQQRINTFAKLRREPEQMISRDWRLIAWGLADECGTLGRAIDDAKLFPVILKEFSGRLATENLTRKMWFGLVSSYFSYRPDQGSGHKNWKQLREFVIKAFDDFRSKQKSIKKWISVVERNRDVFGDTPGGLLGKALVNNEIGAFDEFRTYLQVPSDSWFWRSMIDEQIRQVSKLNDAKFLDRISPMLNFAKTLPFAADTVISGLLTRYEASPISDQAHPALKNAALERWGSPQIGSSRNRWSVNVSESVCKMVMRWFAKEDLETFFKLLQGESGVDQDRLDYWMRFVDQIDYSRIVLGTRAWNDRSSDFIEFREKNRGRISELQGGTSEDNAFIMKIGGYIIVEFSKKNNACYFRPDDNNLPFQLHSTRMDLNKSLKNQSPGHKWLPHAPTQRGWWKKYDAWLAGKGIHTGIAQSRILPDYRHKSESSKIKNKSNDISAIDSTHREKEILKNSNQRIHEIAKTPKATNVIPSIEKNILSALNYLYSNNVVFSRSDRRGRGGAFWIYLSIPNTQVKNKLEEFGFKDAGKRGFWIESSENKIDSPTGNLLKSNRISTSTDQSRKNISPSEFKNKTATSAINNESIIQEALNEAKKLNIQFTTEDNRKKGGVFWFMTKDELMGKKLLTLGFSSHPTQGYWIR